MPKENPNELSERLRASIATDAVSVIAEARTLLKATKDPGRRRALAGVLVDAGVAAGDVVASKLGMTTIKRLLKTDASNSGLQYMLGTAELAMAGHDSTSRPEWWEATRKHQINARKHLWEAAESDLDAPTQAQAWINLGNNLDEGGRWVEAYEAYVLAMRVDFDNPIAAGHAALILNRRGGAPGGPDWQPLAHRLAKTAQSRREFVAWIAPGAEVQFEKLPIDRADEHHEPQTLTPYETFVSTNRLHLSLALDASHPDCWDSLTCPDLTEPMASDNNPPALIAMFNACKADYLLARQLAWDANQVDDDDQHHYLNTLDYARYGSGPARSVLAMRSALDVLDRVGVMANQYFGVGEDPKNVHFRTAWREESKGRPLRTEVKNEIDASNWSVLALVTLSDDFRDDGWLFGRQHLRNIATHRFVISHDMMTGNWRECDEVEHISSAELEEGTIAALRIARSALMYLADAVMRREGRHPRGMSLPLSLPRLGH